MLFNSPRSDRSDEGTPMLRQCALARPPAPAPQRRALLASAVSPPACLRHVRQLAAQSPPPQAAMQFAGRPGQRQQQQPGLHGTPAMAGAAMPPVRRSSPRIAAQLQQPRQREATLHPLTLRARPRPPARRRLLTEADDVQLGGGGRWGWGCSGAGECRAQEGDCVGRPAAAGAFTAATGFAW